MSIPVFISSKGDPDSGAVLVRVNLLNGRSRLFQRSFDLMRNQRSWMLVIEGEDKEIDLQIGREHKRDSDLWVIEVEDRFGRTLLEEPGLKD